MLTAQKRKAMSRGSLMAVRKRMMDKLPTMPRLSARLVPMIIMTTVVISTIRIRVRLKFLEYRVPR